MLHEASEMGVCALLALAVSNCRRVSSGVVGAAETPRRCANPVSALLERGACVMRTHYERVITCAVGDDAFYGDR